MRDFEFSLALIEDSYEKDVDLKVIVMERLEAVYDWYINRYLPNCLYQTVLKVPSDAQAVDYYSAPVGFLRNTTVDKQMLKPGKKRVVRNNYKAIANASAGITNKDLVFFIKYFTEMKDIGEGNIIVYATRVTLSDLVNSLADPGNKDIFNRTGKPSLTIQGIQFIEDDRIPSGKMLMIDGSARDVIVHVVSPKKDLQGSIRLN